LKDGNDLYSIENKNLNRCYPQLYGKEGGIGFAFSYKISLNKMAIDDICLWKKTSNEKPVEERLAICNNCSGVDERCCSYFPTISISLTVSVNYTPAVVSLTPNESNYIKE